MNISIAQFAGPYKKANEFWGKANIQERRRRKELIKVNKEKELYGHRFLVYFSNCFKESKSYDFRIFYV